MAGEFVSALCVKAMAGPANITARLLRGNKPQKPRPNESRQVQNWTSPATMKLAAIRQAKRHVGKRRLKALSPAKRSKAAKELQIP